MELKDYREELDGIDRELAALFIRRMTVSGEISLYKQQNGLAVFDPVREKEKKLALKKDCPPVFCDYLEALYDEIFTLSRNYQKALFPKNDGKNIVLIGMPGSGKTTIAACLAGLTARRFIDMDDLISFRAGMSITDIFKEKGEPVFRAMETALLKEISDEKNCVIATGGGVVTMPENRALLEKTGVIVYVKTALSRLQTAGRPLSLEKGVETLYRERKALYEGWSRYTVTNVTSLETARRIAALTGSEQ